MSFGEKRPQRDQIGPLAAKGSQELYGKSPPLLGFLAPAGAGETVRIGGNGGGLETEIQCSPPANPATQLYCPDPAAGKGGHVHLNGLGFFSDPGKRVGQGAAGGPIVRSRASAAVGMAQGQACRSWAVRDSRGLHRFDLTQIGNAV